MGQIEKIIAGLEPPAVEGLSRAIFPVHDGKGGQLSGVQLYAHAGCSS